MTTLRCWLGWHRPGYTDPTGGDPWMGGPVEIRVCRDGGIELPEARR
jgi:hypothetical protein